MAYYKLNLESNCTSEDTFSTDYLCKSFIIEMSEVDKKSVESMSREIRSKGWAFPNKREFSIKKISDDTYTAHETLYINDEFDNKYHGKLNPLYVHLKQLINSEFRDRKILNYIE